MNLGTVFWYNFRLECKCKLLRQGVGLLQKRLEFDSLSTTLSFTWPAGIL
jgi:hypothetical protein